MILKSGHFIHSRTNGKNIYYHLRLIKYTSKYYLYRKCLSIGLSENNEYLTVDSDEFKIRNDILFFDFYSLYPVWYYYVEKSNFSSHNKDIVNNLFEKITYKLANSVLEALECSINSEISYVFGRRKTKHYGTYISERLRFRRKCNVSLSIDPKYIDIYIKKKAFLDNEMWDDDYGGPLWAIACDLYLELKKNLENYNLNRIILSLDKIFDFQHNTGHILDKGQQFRFLKPAICDFADESDVVLDFRKEASLDQLSIFTSQKVRKICLTLGPRLGLINK